MAPANPFAQMRAKAHYTGPFGDHTMLFHNGLEGDQAAFRAAIADVVDAMLSLQWDGTTWNRLEVAAAGSHLYFDDSAWVTQTSDSTISPVTNSDPAAFLQFGGRSPSDGRRVKFYLLETVATPNEKMRYLVGDNAPVAAVVAALEDAGSVLGTITGSEIQYYQYANQGNNDYLVHRARRS